MSYNRIVILLLLGVIGSQVFAQTENSKTDSGKIIDHKKSNNVNTLDQQNILLTH